MNEKHTTFFKAVFANSHPPDSHKVSAKNMIPRTHTKSINIDAPFNQVFSFLAHAPNWPQWAVVNVLGIGAEVDGWWEMQTPLGDAKLRIRAEKEKGLLDHDFNSREAAWSVPARLLPNADGCTFIITFSQPPMFTDSFFDQQMDLIDEEMDTLKRIMEKRS